MNKVPEISGSLTAAFGFENIKLNIFGCELEPNCPVDDYYTLQGGGAAQPDANLPSPEAVDRAIPSAETPEEQEDIPYILPTSGQDNVAPSGALSSIVSAENDAIGAQLDAELERAQAGDRSGLDDALEIQ